MFWQPPQLTQACRTVDRPMESDWWPGCLDKIPRLYATRCVHACSCPNARGPEGQRRRAATAPSAPWAILLVQPSPEIGDRPNPFVESGKVAAQWRPRSWGVARNRIPVRPAHNSLESVAAPEGSGAGRRTTYPGSGWVVCGRLSGRRKQTRQFVFASAPRLVEHMEWNTQVTQPINNVARSVGRSERPRRGSPRLHFLYS